MAATPERVDPIDGLGTYRNWGERGQNIHVDHVYVALVNAAKTMEDRLKTSLENYEAHPDVQANLQQLQYDLQSWNLALTTMTNIQKNMADALKSVASNFR
ncbi:MAG: hypothetical protein IKZ36_05705 [Kiritimatiellae bacterium]|nr:hypothetical protein [Kiritimatiellia bacterium]